MAGPEILHALQLRCAHHPYDHQELGPIRQILARKPLAQVFAQRDRFEVAAGRALARPITVKGSIHRLGSK